MPAHHPSEATLACHAAGTLAGPAATAVSMHLAVCPACRRAVRDAEAAAAAALLDEVPAEMGEGALAATLRRIVAGPPPRPVAAAPDLSERGAGWAGPGLRRRLLGRDGDARLWLLRMEPGAAVPWHAHTGTELTLFLRGRFRDPAGSYRPGDLREYTDGEADRLECVGDGPGVGLLAVEGPLLYRHWLPRLVMPSY